MTVPNYVFIKMNEGRFRRNVCVVYVVSHRGEG